MHGIKMGVLPSDEISNTEPVAPVVGNRMAYFGPQQGARELRFIFPGRHTSISHLRTTLTLDEDVAAKLREETRRRNTSFKETVNACLRRGLEAPTDRSWQGHSASSRGGWVCEPESTSTTSGACWIFSTVRPADDARRHQPAALCLRRGHSPRHAPARRWLTSALSSGRPVRLALISVLAFVRIASAPKGEISRPRRIRRRYRTSARSATRIGPARHDERPRAPRRPLLAVPGQ